MIKKSKGFMLAEVVVTSTVVLTALVGLYTTYNKLYNQYKIRETYYDIDGMNMLKNIINHTLETRNINTYIKAAEEKGYYHIMGDNNIPYSGDRVFNEIINLYFIKYNKEDLTNFKGEGIRRTCKDYVDYLIKHSKFDSTGKNKDFEYIFILEAGNKNDNDNISYSSMGVG